MRNFILLRGLPGSGKSSFIKNLKNKNVVHSTDNYWIKNGKYLFDPDKLGVAHQWNINNFKNSVENGINLVVCDNTNLSPKEYSPYIKLAKENKYQVISIVFEPEDIDILYKRNIHGVPKETLKRMIKKFKNNKITINSDIEIIGKNYYKLSEIVSKFI